MTQEAFELYDQALSEQHTRNEARRIRTRVTEARRSPHAANFRWPFELLQNAVDSGARNGGLIRVSFRREEERLTFEHDGSPFTSVELAALLSGGSSKEFESEVTTGRFGTGFLVTHVLAEHTTLRGLLQVPGGLEQFELSLDRSGDEQAILKNIQTCKEAIRSATIVEDANGLPSACFEYPIIENDALLVGFNALREALPNLYLTRQLLGRVEIEEDGITEIWSPSEVIAETYEEGYVEHRSISIRRDGDFLPELHVYRFKEHEGTSSSALVILEEFGGSWRVRPTPEEVPKIYREYPLRGSGFLPINIVLDGKFEPDQERTKLLMSKEDKSSLVDAFGAAALAVKYASAQGWDGSHFLARAANTGAAFNPTDEAEKSWWAEQLREFADRIARLPIVQCVSGKLPAIFDEGWAADFVVPRLLLDSREDETTVKRLWPLVSAADDLVPPLEELAKDWSDIAEEWHGLGLKISRITLSELAEYVCKDAKELDELAIDCDAPEWLAEFLDIVGECWNSRAGVELAVLQGLLPNQNDRLQSPQELSRDGGVSEQLKDISERIGCGVRVNLLSARLEEIGARKQLQYLKETLNKAIGTITHEADVIRNVVQYLESHLPEDESCEEGTEALQDGTAQILSYLWHSASRDAATAKKVPLISSNQRSVRWSHDRMMMAPVEFWDESARPFAEAYPPSRVLSNLYMSSAHGRTSDTVAALVGFGIAIADPISKDSPSELKGARLAAICSGDTEGAVVTSETFSQIALLQPELLNRCQEGVDEARALFGLVLCHVARHDPNWRQERTIKGRKSREAIELRASGALWLADLKYRSWVPIEGEDEKIDKVRADSKTLSHLLDPSWLEDNSDAIELLTQNFDFDELELRLLGLAPDPTKRAELRSQIAKLVQSGGAEPEFYAILVEQVEDQRQRSRDIQRCRRLGIAVQEAVRAAIENYGLNLELIDRGFDYEVTASADDLLLDAGSQFDVGSYLLEVKATTTGYARMTPKQAQTAAQQSHRYALCVVDLRSLPDDSLDEDWTAEMVEPLVKIISDIGDKVADTYQLIETASVSTVTLCNESSLRYEVSSLIWELGVPISDWVLDISNRVSIKPAAAQ